LSHTFANFIANQRGAIDFRPGFTSRTDVN